MTRLVHRARVGLIVTAAGLLFGLLIAMTALAFTDAAVGGSVPRFVGLANYNQLLHSLLFRRAVAHTLLVVPPALLIVLAAAAGTHAYWRHTGAIGKVFFCCALLPLAMPSSVGALAWRAVLEQIHLPLVQSNVTLAAFAVVYAWRAFPVTLAFLTTPWLQQRRTRWVVAVGAAAGWMLVDLSTVLVISGGQPANGTHLLASWTYVTAVTGGMIGLGAAMATILWGALGLLVLAVGGLVYGNAGSHRSVVDAGVPLLRQGVWRTYAGGVVQLWLLLPLLIVLWRSGALWRWPAGFAVLFSATGFMGWLATTAGLVLFCTAVVWPVVRLGSGRTTLSAMGLIVPAGGALSAGFLLFAWLPAGGFTLFCVWIGAIALCLAAGISALRHPKSMSLASIAVGALFLVTQSFGSALAVGGTANRLLTTGPLTALAYRSDLAPNVLPLALLLTTALLLLTYCSLLWRPAGS